MEQSKRLYNLNVVTSFVLFFHSQTLSIACATSKIHIFLAFDWTDQRIINLESELVRATTPFAFSIHEKLFIYHSPFIAGENSRKTIGLLHRLSHSNTATIGVRGVELNIHVLHTWSREEETRNGPGGSVYRHAGIPYGEN